MDMHAQLSQSHTYTACHSYTTYIPMYQLYTHYNTFEQVMPSVLILWGPSHKLDNDYDNISHEDNRGFDYVAIFPHFWDSVSYQIHLMSGL